MYAHRTDTAGQRGYGYRSAHNCANAASLSGVFGSTGGAIIIAVSITLFAFSSLLSWGYYGARCCEFMFGLRSLSAYRLLSAPRPWLGL